MKQSDKATAHILVKAGTNSEWDECSFAIIHITEQWKKEQAQRLEMVKPFARDYNFCSINFYDMAADFYRADENDNPDIESLLGEKEWVFVELDEDEQETFTAPESRLDCYRLVLRSNGTACYTAYGKHTGEEFWTEEFLLTQLIQQL